MDHRKVEEWSKAVDHAEQSSLVANLPKEAEAGSIFTEETPEGTRSWLRIAIIAGNNGGRWAYWLRWTDPETKRDGIGSHPEFKAIADNIFNGDAAHFIGMLGIPYQKIPGAASLLGAHLSRMTATLFPKQYEEPSRERYEKSKEVYDVDTHASTRLP